MRLSNELLRTTERRADTRPAVGPFSDGLDESAGRPIRLVLWAIVVLGVIVPIGIATGTVNGFFACATLALWLVAPGYLLTWLSRLPTGSATLVAVPLLGFSSLTVLATGLSLVSWWHPEAWTIGLSIVSLLGAGTTLASTASSRHLRRELSALTHLRPVLRPVQPSVWMPVAVMCVGALLWLISLPAIDPLRATDWGLLTVLPVTTWIGTTLVLGAWAWSFVPASAWSKPHFELIRWGGLVPALTVVYGLQPALEPVARLGTTWIHLGIIERYALTGQSIDGIDARFSWPGFFTAWGFVSRAATDLPLDAIARWYPLVVSLCVAVLTYHLGRRLNFSPRQAFLAMAVISVSNWIEQDYFSVQGTAHIMGLLLLVLAVSPAGRSMGRIGCITLLAAAIACSHQLTAPVLAVQLLVLCVLLVRRRRPVTTAVFALLAVVMIEVLWLGLGARAFWSSNISFLIGDPGALQGTIDQNLGSRLADGAAGLQVMRLVRVAITAALVALAAWGAWRQRQRKGSWAWELGLAAAPWVFVPIQSYGGEMFMRCLLFGLPFLALSASRIATSGEDTRLRRRTPGRALSGIAALAVAGIVLIAARGGNDGFATYRLEEKTLTGTMLSNLPTGATVLIPSRSAGMMSFSRWGEVKATNMSVTCSEAADLAACLTVAQPANILVTESAARLETLAGGSPRTWMQKAIDAAVAKGYHVRVRNAGGAWLTARQASTVNTEATLAPVPIYVGPLQAILIALGLMTLLFGAWALPRGWRDLQRHERLLVLLPGVGVLLCFSWDLLSVILAARRA